MRISSLQNLGDAAKGAAEVGAAALSESTMRVRSAHAVVGLSWIGLLLDTITAQFDASPPVVTSFAVWPSAIDVTEGQAVASINMTWTDNFGGYSSGWVQFRSPSGAHDVDTWFSATSATGEFSQTRTVTFGQYIEPGVWIVSFVWVGDDNQNGAFYVNQAYSSSCYSGYSMGYTSSHSCASFDLSESMVYVNIPAPTLTPTVTRAPTPVPSDAPTFAPSAVPTPVPTPVPTVSSYPTPRPTLPPTETPTTPPSPAPSFQPSPAPVPSPTMLPTSFPTSRPTSMPAPEPSRWPSPYPSSRPTSPEPTPPPTSAPSSGDDMAQTIMVWAIIIGAVVIAFIIAITCAAFKLGQSTARNQSAPAMGGQVVQLVPQVVHQQTAPTLTTGVRVVPVNQTPIQLSPNNVEVVQIKGPDTSTGPINGAKSYSA